MPSPGICLVQACPDLARGLPRMVTDVALPFNRNTLIMLIWYRCSGARARAGTTDPFPFPVMGFLYSSRCRSDSISRRASSGFRFADTAPEQRSQWPVSRRPDQLPLRSTALLLGTVSWPSRGARPRSCSYTLAGLQIYRANTRARISRRVQVSERGHGCRFSAGPQSASSSHAFASSRRSGCARGPQFRAPY